VLGWTSDNPYTGILQNLRNLPNRSLTINVPDLGEELRQLFVLEFEGEAELTVGVAQTPQFGENAKQFREHDVLSGQRQQ
jgi:hypothetical protein